MIFLTKRYLDEIIDVYKNVQDDNDIYYNLFKNPYKLIFKFMLLKCLLRIRTIENHKDKDNDNFENIKIKSNL